MSNGIEIVLQQKQNEYEEIMYELVNKISKRDCLQKDINTLNTTAGFSYNNTLLQQQFQQFQESQKANLQVSLDLQNGEVSDLQNNANDIQREIEVMKVQLIKEFENEEKFLKDQVQLLQQRIVDIKNKKVAMLRNVVLREDNKNPFTLPTVLKSVEWERKAAGYHLAAANAREKEANV